MEIGKIEKQRKQEENQLSKEVAEFAKAYTKKNPQEVKKTRLEYLEERKKEIEQEIEEIKSLKDGWVVGSFWEEDKKELKRVTAQKKALESNEPMRDKITDQMIVNAKEYPIENLIEVDSRGFAKCLWHDDNNPSMFCKNGFVHCFSCQKSGSAIDVFMQINGVGFKTAVKKMQI